MAAAQKPSYLIVGAGVFGVSTAYSLIQKYPDASVTIVDRDAFDAESRVAASWDWNKVVRADYDDLIYCKLALEAQDIFNSDPLWKPFFHETGIFWMSRNGYAQEVIDNYKKLGRKADLSAVPVAEARKMYGGLFEHADYTGVKEVLINKSSGWAAAGDCLVAITRHILQLGVKYVTEEAATLRFNKSGRCVGLTTTAGTTHLASHVILCTGAFTPKLLELSAASSGIADLRAGSRILAGGITTGMAVLDEETYEKFASMPVGVQWYSTETKISEFLSLICDRNFLIAVTNSSMLVLSLGPFIGSLPPTKDRELKWWGETIFKNTREILPGRHISMPPSDPDYAQWKVSKKLKEDIAYSKEVFYGDTGAHWKMDKHRICWYVITRCYPII